MTAATWIEFIAATHARHHSCWPTMAAATGDLPARVAAVGPGADDPVTINGEWLIRIRNVNDEEQSNGHGALQKG